MTDANNRGDGHEPRSRGAAAVTVEPETVEVEPVDDATATAVLREFPADRLLATLEMMWRIRKLEEKVEELYSLGRVHGTMHLSIGQEAVPAGWSLALRDDDFLLSHHRGHGHAMAKGAKADRMIAELLGRQAGYGRGRGGSMHIADVTVGNLGANGIVGGGGPHRRRPWARRQAAGAGRPGAVDLRRWGGEPGRLPRVAELALVWPHLQVVCLFGENNQYGMSMAATHAMRRSPAEHAVAYGMPSLRVDGNDVVAVLSAVREAAASIRAGEGPWLVEAVTYRYRGRSKSDRNLYRTRDEIAEWRARDPIPRFAARLEKAGIADAAQTAAAEQRAHDEIEAAVTWAEAQPEPRCEDLLEGVYAE